MVELTSGKIQEIKMEVRDIKRKVKYEQSFFHNKKEPYYIKLCGYMLRIARIEEYLKKNYA